MNLTVILVIILTTVLFVLNYRMLQMKKNVTNIVDQIVAAHSRDKNFKNQEFLHYYKSNGNIWLSAMEPMFRKSLTLKAAVCVFSIVGALVMIGLAYVEDIYILAVYPFLLLVFLIKLAMDIELVSSDDKKNAKKSMSNLSLIHI